MYKSKLNDLCQKRKWALPTYACIRTGEDHNPLFSASVMAHGIIFNTPADSKSSKQAHNEAAELAFLHFTSEPSNRRSENVGKTSNNEKEVKSSVCLENDPRSYKILLQELTKSEGFFMPIYKTFGSDHEPTLQAFFSTVDVEGEIFKGDMAKSKKLAELNAAKAAYTALIERKLFDPGYFSPNVDELAPRLGSVTISAPRKKPISGSPSIISASTKNETRAQETTGENEEIKEDEKSYLLGKRFKVYKSIPNMVLPEGTVLLPICENMWTIVALEFPNTQLSPF